MLAIQASSNDRIRSSHKTKPTFPPGCHTDRKVDFIIITNLEIIA